MKNAEVWLIDFNPQVGAEVKKMRPAIIVSNNAVGSLPLKIVVPVTDLSKGKMLWHVELKPNKINGLTKSSVADCFQVKSISENRFVKKIGKLSEEEMVNIKATLMLVMDIV